MPRLTLDEVHALALSRLTALGASEVAAQSVARSMVRAEADDIQSVGLGYLPTFLTHLTTGKVDGRVVPKVERPTPALVTVDAGNGFAHPAFEAGLPALIDAAKQNGLAALSIRRSYSAGVIGHWVEDLADRGLVALMMTNAPANMAPVGGTKPLFGTNPIAFASPRPAAPPLVIDLATTTVARVSLMAKIRAGERIPDGWALDAAGKPTNDPDAALAGTMQGLGGAKGVLLALMVDLMAGALTGSNLSMQASPFSKADGPPPGIGELIVAFDPARFSARYLEQVEALMTAMLAQEGVRLPGDRRLAARERAARAGVEVPQTLLDEINAVGRAP